jgi:hypothetical protein
MLTRRPSISAFPKKSCGLVGKRQGFVNDRPGGKRITCQPAAVSASARFSRLRCTED